LDTLPKIDGSTRIKPGFSHKEHPNEISLKLPGALPGVDKRCFKPSL
jgi:hypothetical protein